MEQTAKNKKNKLSKKFLKEQSEETLKPPTSERWLNRVLFFVPVLVGFLVYVKSIWYEDTNYDDPYVVFQNALIQNFDLWSLLSKEQAGLYHPVVSITLALDYWIGSGNPGVFHFTNMLFHLASGVLVFLAIKKLFERKLEAVNWLAFFCSCIFLLHPLKVESVGWITERKDMVSGFFLVLSWLMFLYWSDSQKKSHLFFSWLGFFLSMASKVTVLFFPCFLLVLQWWKNGRVTIRHVLLQLFFLVSVLPIFVANVIAQSQHKLDPNIGLDLLPRVARQFAFYHEKFIFPFELRPIYLLENMQLTALTFVAALLFVGLLFWIFKYHREDRKNLILGYAFFILTIGPVLKIISYGDENIVNDRYMYIPILGLCLAYLPTIAKWMETKKTTFKKSMVGAGVLVMGWHSYLSFEQLSIWQNSEALWRHVIKLEPESKRAATNLGKVYLQKDQCKEALFYLEKGDLTGENLANIAYCANLMGDKQKAFDILERGLRLAPTDANMLNMLSVLYIQAQKFGEAAKVLDVALANLKAELGAALRSQIYMHKGLVNFSLGQFDEAEQKMRSALEIMKVDDRIYHNLGLIHIKQGKYDESAKAFLAALKLNPRRVESLHALGILYAKQGKMAEARPYFVKALQINPNYGPSVDSLQRLEAGQKLEF